MGGDVAGESVRDIRGFVCDVECCDMSADAARE